MFNYIEEYLVRLGADVDTSSFRKLESTLKQTTHGVDGYAAQWVKASGIVAAAISTVTGAMLSLAVKTANQDLEMQTYARTMMIGTQQAYQMKAALDALGKSAQDVQITPELRERYKSLLGDSNRMMPGKDFAAQQRNVRDLLFEITRFKQEMQFMLKWISYYIVKDLQEPLAKAGVKLRSFNEYIIKNMPKISRILSDGFGYIINIAINVFRAFKAVAVGLKEIWDHLPSAIKKTTVALSILFAVLKASPMGRLSMIIGAIMLLIDDFFAYLDGKESAFGPFWKEVIDLWSKLMVVIDDANGELSKFWNELKGNVIFLEFVDTCKECLSVLWDLVKVFFKAAKEGLGGLWEIMKELGIPKAFLSTMKSIFLAFVDIWKGLINVNKILVKFLKLLLGDPNIRPFWKAVGQIFVEFNKQLLVVLGTLGKIGRVIGLLLQGKFKAAAGLIMGDDNADVGQVGEGGLGIMQSLINGGLNPNAAAALVGHMDRESGLNPGAYNPNDNGAPSGGLIQWHADRLENLQAYAASKGVSWDDKKTQIEFLLQELKDKYPEVYNDVQNASSVEEASRIFLNRFIIPEDRSESAYQYRLEPGLAVKKQYEEAQAKAREEAAAKEKAAAVDRSLPQTTSSVGNVIAAQAKSWWEGAKAIWNNITGGNNYATANTGMSIGSINVNVANSNATPQDIANATANGVARGIGGFNRPITDVRPNRGVIR